MNLGIIGKGKIVQEFLPHLKQVEGLTLTALMGSPGKEAEAAAFCAAHAILHTAETPEDFLRLGVDTVYVATPNLLHFDYCRRALELGLHVICEKPMCTTAREVEILRDLAEEKGLLLFEAITTLHYSAYAQIRRWLPQIGRVKLVQSQFSQYSSRYDAFLRGQVLPAFDPAMAGGALMDLGVYNLHFVLGLFGMPRSWQYLANVDRGIDTSGILTLKYPEFVAVCIAAKDSKGTCGCVIQGEKGIIRVEMAPSLLGEVRLQRNDGTEETFYSDETRLRAAREFAVFAGAIAGRDLAFRDEMLEKTLAVTRVTESARQQAGIRFPGE